MDLSYTDEQRLLQDSAARFVARAYDAATRRAILQRDAPFSPDVWRAMADLGWLGLTLPEDAGGSGGDAVDASILMAALGKGLVLEPFASTVLLGGHLVAEAGSDQQRQHWIPRIAAGEVRLAFAHAEAGVRHEDAPATCRATPADGGWVIDGEKRFVVDAPCADHVLVSAVTRIGARDVTGVFIVPRDARGLHLSTFRCADGRAAAHLQLRQVRVDDAGRLSRLDDVGPVIEAALDGATAAFCAEAVGCIEALLDRTVAYAKARIQFGQPIAVNQALRHRMVDMAVQCEEAKAIALRACLHLRRDADERARAVCGAKVRVARAARFVSEGAIQIHGAMGVTDELDVGAYVKRLLAIEMSYGTPADCQRRLVSLRARSGGPRAFA